MGFWLSRVTGWGGGARRGVPCSGIEVWDEGPHGWPRDPGATVLGQVNT